ncbi:MAG TPA: PilN domain-containing protein [Burkholderiaceae bacterium]|nr:PilN domain-containing protein [Burkholderiaceae bacterium]
MVLFRDIDIPIQNAEEKAAATSLAVQMLSPFAHEDGVWGVGSVLGRDTTMAAIASRNHIRQYAQRFSESHGMDAVRDVAHCEVWCCPANALPVVLVGFAEPMRYRQVRRNRWLSHIALAVCLLVAAAILATPLAQLALKAESAQKQGHAAQVETRSAQALREALLSNQAKLVSVSKISLESQQPPEILARVTAVVPDDTWVQRLQWQSGKVTLQGQTPNVATLMASLSKQPDIKEVKAPAAATKSAGSGKENFSVEFVLLPAAASVVGGGNGVGPGESGAP